MNDGGYNITFYAFCSFWSVIINIIDKLQFLIFINSNTLQFAVEQLLKPFPDVFRKTVKMF